MGLAFQIGNYITLLKEKKYAWWNVPEKCSKFYQSFRFHFILYLMNALVYIVNQGLIVNTWIEKR